MLGIQENRPDAGSLPARTYRCMACAAVFPGLSSLLVHQASHANDKTPDSLQSPADSCQQPCTSCGTMFANKDILDQHNCKAVETSSSASVYISECGSDFQDVNTINEHRKSCEVNPQVNSLAPATNNASEISNPSQHGSTFSPDSQSFNVISQSVPVLLVHPPYQQLSSKLADAEMGAKAAETLSPVSQATEFPSLPIHISSQDLLLHTDPSPSNSLSGSEVSGIEQKDVRSPKKTLKKLLVSAFMERLPPAQTSWKPNKEHVVPKTVAPEASTEAPAPLGSSVRHLRRLLTKSANKTKAAAKNTLGVLSSNKPSTQAVGNTVNLNDTFLPVVALETRQKLLGVSKDGQEGRHQCGFCRRIFQHVDNLILHHAVHKKEKIFGCRGCKQLLITKAAIPLHHACPPDISRKHAFSEGFVLPSSLGNLVNSSQKSTLEHSSVRGPFFCHLCKHGFTRLYGLKKHKCQFFSHARSSHQKSKVNVNSSSKKMVENQESRIHKNVAVSTEAPGLVKVEQFEGGPTQAVLLKPQEKGPARPGSPKSFMPFISKTAMQKCPATELDERIKIETEDKVTNNSAQEDDEQGQWIVPIDESEIDVLVEGENKEHLCLMETDTGDVGSSSVQNGSLSTQLSGNYLTHISEAGKKRFVCHNCGKSYARRFTLKQHLKSCQIPAGTPMQQDTKKSPLIKGMSSCQRKQSFDCLQCGKSFSRRYNMVLHKKRYHFVNTTVVASGSHSKMEGRTNILPQQSPGTSGEPVSQKRMLIIPPPPGNEDSGMRSENQATVGDWGIMSLPSVLPRKVTCECGSVFTCPRLLFEHLQMHAQESFICPQCGETYCSWPNYEMHLHTHQRSVCPNCKQTFTLQKSLVRHLTKNRCKANFPNGKKFVCSHCGLELSSYPSLSLHIQNCQHNPSRKLIRCLTCTRSFSTKEGLQKHLFTHSHPNAFRCLLCQRSYPSLQSLKDHRRKVHHIKLGGVQAVQSK
ncbi:zinc finger protein 84 [Scleropages formosus]|uniref:zinc finger protein 84 n=1 Tax=Scleropages formosus TaxID=113540 RepID=UPI0010FA8745|nr:zinc finger protein 84-like [Scleropages formosus]XP_018587738.2 zinc finger protein 84-like [Scleropages formosus]